jgi:hypothetical protein
MNRLFKEPLVHFLLAGALLFILFGLVEQGDGSGPDSDAVLVDEAALLRFVQYRMKAFEPSLAKKRLDALSDEERQRLIDDFVREEVLYREALALGLDREDYVIRRRLVQKLEFITEGFAEAVTQPDEAALQRYFEANRRDYYVEPYVTFTHVFFDAEKHGSEKALELARRELQLLNAKKVHFSEAPRHGDRFLYHLNYVERTPEFIASHFGAPMAKAIFELEPNEEIWRGPFESPYGAHLVMLTSRAPGRDAELAELRDRVLEDARRDLIREQTEEAIDEIIGSYDVQIRYEPSLQPTAAPEPGSLDAKAAAQGRP